MRGTPSVIWQSAGATPLVRVGGGGAVPLQQQQQYRGPRGVGGGGGERQQQQQQSGGPPEVCRPAADPADVVPCSEFRSASEPAPATPPARHQGPAPLPARYLPARLTAAAAPPAAAVVALRRPRPRPRPAVTARAAGNARSVAARAARTRGVSARSRCSALFGPLGVRERDNGPGRAHPATAATRYGPAETGLIGHSRRAGVEAGRQGGGGGGGAGCSDRPTCRVGDRNVSGRSGWLALLSVCIEFTAIAHRESFLFNIRISYHSFLY